MCLLDAKTLLRWFICESTIWEHVLEKDGDAMQCGELNNYIITS